MTMTVAVSLLFLAVVLAQIPIYLGIVNRRHRQDLSEYLVPDLSKCGLKLVSAVFPGRFKVGPFPKFEMTIGPASCVGGVRGEYSEYRVVTCTDAAGRTYELWAQVHFELFRFRNIRWRAENKAALPQNVWSILEN